MADLDTMMPPAGVGEETEEERLRRLSPLAPRLPAAAVQPSSETPKASPPTIPPLAASPVRPEANAAHPAIPPLAASAPPSAALAQPSLPPVGKAEMAAPD